MDDLKNVKIADFGLARDIFAREYYKQDGRPRPLPIKWMAIECVVMDAKKFTVKSDVVGTIIKFFVIQYIHAQTFWLNLLTHFGNYEPAGESAHVRESGENWDRGELGCLT